MTIKDVADKFDISCDILRNYERVGMIPPAARTPSGIRGCGVLYLGRVELVLCMRGAGLPIPVIVEYVKLFRMGDGTIGARPELLREQYEELF